MSSKDKKKKTQRELIEDLTILVKRLAERITVLEGRNWPHRPWGEPKPYESKKCPHCKGTGKIKDNWDPYHPYYNHSC